MSQEHLGNLEHLNSFRISTDTAQPIYKVIRNQVVGDLGERTLSTFHSSYEEVGAIEIKPLESRIAFLGTSMRMRNYFDEKGERAGNKFLLKPRLTPQTSAFFERVINAAPDPRDKAHITEIMNLNIPFIDYGGENEGVSIVVPNHYEINRTGNKTTVHDGNYEQDQTYYLSVRSANKLGPYIQPGSEQETTYYDNFRYQMDIDSLPKRVIDELGNRSLIADIKLINWTSEEIKNTINEAAMLGYLDSELLVNLANVTLDVR